MTFILVFGAIVIAVCSVIVLGIMKHEMNQLNNNNIREMEMKFNKKRKK